MEAFDLLMTGFDTLLTPTRIGFMMLGIILGLLVGVLPGVGGTTGVAILLPVTVFFEPVSALVMLAGIYWGSMYGGLITSILFGVPGNPWSVAVMFDGRPLAKQGKAGLAMSTGFWVSFFGAIIASVLFTFFAVPFAEMALRFGPPEMFAVLMIAFGTFIGMGGSPGKALIMIAAGFLLSTVGLDVVTGQPRLTFGTIELMRGFHFVPITIGLFGIGEVLANAAERYKVQIEDVTRAAKLGMHDITAGARAVFSNIGLASSSAVLGFITGILPGAGATPASFMAYGFAQKISKHPEKFGKGAIEGVIAPEAANNAAGTGAILPMLVLGIPGSPTAAILMAGVFMWGFIPGPRLFTEQPEFVWSFIASLYLANIAALLICLTATPLLAMMLRTPYAIMAPLIVVLSLIGAYAIQNAFLDVWLAVIFGVIGFILRRMDYPLAPLIVALVLGFSTEEALRQSLIMSDGSMAIFFQRPLSAPIMVVALLLFMLPLFRMFLRRYRRRQQASTGE
ncbi:tripartite tricarboxylate transporter permease [Allomesorhizobium camelthorni]|uniref:Tripartite tricarboxylate transporter permease n=1 Tax=Allomesorhizobium camelthorni TaxID=475069 RepID=A0A6G4WP03_9HYPH|nr:tripartite tricarboxylate transporter permease [Mesorhizobium camelthorni]NGO55797.1 tripartite tricarboxylate transporter permease [Mesorhizobium camelthorni]